MEMSVHRHLNRVLPPASPKMTGVCGGTWKYPFPFWTRFSCSPFTVDTRTQPCCQTLRVPAVLWRLKETVQWSNRYTQWSSISNAAEVWQWVESQPDSLPWFTSFSSSSMGLMRVLGQNSSRAWSSSPPRFTTKGEAVMQFSVSFGSALISSYLYIKWDWSRYLTLRVGSIRAWEPSVLCRYPGREAVALIQCDGEHLLKMRSRPMRLTSDQLQEGLLSWTQLLTDR